MQEKYLPIGTVCTLKNNNKNIMIVGYFSIEYNGNVKMYEYSGIVYPEGNLLPAQTYSFNQSDIAEIKFVGYKNDQFTTFNNSLNRNKADANAKYQKKEFMANLKFDENGVVVFDGVEELKVESKPVEEVIENPFQEKIESRPSEVSKSVFKFDENGTVISDGTVESTETVKPRYKFDENGYVISDDLDNDTSNDSGNSSSSYKFDENGMVIEEEPIVELKPINLYKFDEDGVIIGDESDIANEVATNNMQTNSSITFDENGYVVSE